MPKNNGYNEYLNIVADPDKIEKVTRLDFLNPDNSVAFSIDNRERSKMKNGVNYSSAFIQSGNLSVSLQNGQRRKANITLANLDGTFDYAVNKLWSGQRVRLSMGVKLSDGSDYLLSQGVFYLASPQLGWLPSGRQATYSLVDKWSYLDGTVYGTLHDTYEIQAGENQFVAIEALLRQSIYTQRATNNIWEMLDNVSPIFTDYYNNQYFSSGGQVYSKAQVPKDIIVEYGKTFADILLEINNLNAGWIGYDASGALTITPSDNDISDQTKPMLWEFDVNSKTFCSLNETFEIGDVYNNVLIYGDSINEGAIPFGQARNNDPSSDTNIGRIGLKPYVESAAGYYTDEQCVALAEFKLKRMTVLQKSVTIESTQMFHLQENGLISVKRTDKQGSPIEKHLIQSYTIPLAQQGNMTITATSVFDFPNIEKTTSQQWN